MNRALIFILSVSSFLTFGQIDPSDGCTGIPTLPVGTTCTYNTYDLPGSYANGGLVIASCAANQNRDDGWYQFTATSTTTDIYLTGNRRHLVSVWTSCAGGSEIACDQADGGDVAFVSFTTTIGVTYFVQVQRRQSNNTTSMNGEICITEPIIPPTDCGIATQVCSDAGFPGNSSGFGVQELDATNSGCLDTEHESSWYLISIGTTGTLSFVISPDNGTDDYDFAVWGPDEPCPPSTAPIRCSYACCGGNTGVNTGLNCCSPETTEAAFGGADGFVDDISVTVGEVYTLLVDNFSSTTSPFTFSFGGSAGVSCVPLPVQLVSFEGEHDSGANVLTWVTKSEINNAFYTVEHSADGINWEVAGTYEGAGNSSVELQYTYRHENYVQGVNYYRLFQTDFDGVKADLGSITIVNEPGTKKLVKIVNIYGQEVPETYEGVRIYMYSDGSSEKKVFFEE
ncbi:MAG: hypothetical protein MK078_10055 [Crocinitomicaceae bacterium]|nr:hypothetical protein [Crocinitomicaceae bacterium]